MSIKEEVEETRFLLDTNVLEAEAFDFLGAWMTPGTSSLTEPSSFN
jgi:hypothetical protein